MRARVEWLSAAERSGIIDQALQALAETGMRLGACQALKELEAKGAQIDSQAGVARLPRDLVERTVARLPRSVLLAGATPDDDCLLDGRAISCLRGRRPRPSTSRRGSTGRAPWKMCAGRPSSPTPCPQSTSFGRSSARPTRRRRGRLQLPADHPAWSNKHVQDEVTQPARVRADARLSGDPLRRSRRLSRRPRLQFQLLHDVPARHRWTASDASIGVARPVPPS